MHDFLQEEGRIQNKSGPSREDHVALTSKTTKGKMTFNPKKFQKEKLKTAYGGKNFDLSRVRCFNCQKLGHFAKDCRSKKKDFKGKHHASTAIEEEEDSRKK